MMKIVKRAQTINNTKIQYISVADSKIYKVKDIDFRNLTIKAAETNLSIADIPENEVFPVEEFGEFRVRLINGDSGALRPFGRRPIYCHEIALSIPWLIQFIFGSDYNVDKGLIGVISRLWVVDRELIV